MSAVSKWTMAMVGLFIPEARESAEMMYEFEKPFVVDSGKHVIPFRGVRMADPARVVGFMEDRIGLLSREGLSYATEKLPPSTRTRPRALPRTQV